MGEGKTLQLLPSNGQGPGIFVVAAVDRASVHRTHRVLAFLDRPAPPQRRRPRPPTGDVSLDGRLDAAGRSQGPGGWRSIANPLTHKLRQPLGCPTR